MLQFHRVKGVGMGCGVWCGGWRASVSAGGGLRLMHRVTDDERSLSVHKQTQTQMHMQAHLCWSRTRTLSAGQAVGGEWPIRRCRGSGRSRRRCCRRGADERRREEWPASLCRPSNRSSPLTAPLTAADSQWHQSTSQSDSDRRRSAVAAEPMRADSGPKLSRSLTRSQTKGRRRG